MDAADAIEKRNKQLMDSLQRQWLQASGERIKLIEFDRDAAIKGLDDKELSEQQHADAVVLINQTAAREIAGERVRLADSIKSPDQLGVQSVFSLTDALKGMGVAASSAFEDAIAGGKGFSEVLQGLATDLEKLLVRKFATEPLMRLLDMGITAGGNALTQWWTGYSSHTVTADWTEPARPEGRARRRVRGRQRHPVRPRRARSSGRRMFPMARGYGLMGEAGPEAVLPLTRLPSGKLGVGSAGGPAVVNNVKSSTTTPARRSAPRSSRTAGGGMDLTVDHRRRRTGDGAARCSGQARRSTARLGLPATRSGRAETMPAWPSDLPQRPLVEGFSETAPTLTVRSPMDVGPAKVRRRVTAGVTQLKCAFRLSTTQRASLLTFWQTTLAGGALSFTWTHPISGAAITCRIVEPPAFTPAARGVSWVAALTIEVLP